MLNRHWLGLMINGWLVGMMYHMAQNFGGENFDKWVSGKI